MAADQSGAILGNYVHGIRLEYHWSRIETSIPDNKSTIYWELRVGCTSSINFSAKKNWTCTVDGVSYSGSYSGGMQGTNITKTVGSGTTEITHNADGTRGFAVSATLGIKITITSTGEYLGNISLSGSSTLNAIPRMSTLSASDGTLGTSQKLTVTRQASSFTHTIKYECGTQSGTVCTKSSAVSITWTPPLSLAAQNTSGSAVTIILSIETYSGDTSLGVNTTAIGCGIPDSVKPSLSIVSVQDDNGYLTTYGAYVQNKSALKISLSAAGSYGSSITAYRTSVDGSTYTDKTIVTAVLRTSGTLQVSATVTDSRGRTATATKEISVLAYKDPQITQIKAYRCNASGTALANGAYLKVVFSASVSSLNSKNSAAYTESHRQATSTSMSVAVALSDYSGDYTVSDGSYVFSAAQSATFVVRITVSDDFGSTYKETTGPASGAVFSILAKGLGFALGKIAELAETFDCAWDAVFRKGVTVGDTSLSQALLDGNTIARKFGQNASETTTWFKAAETTMGNYTDANLNLLITRAYGDLGGLGILQIRVRCNNAAISKANILWLCKSGTIDNGDMCMYVNGLTVGFYIKTRQRYMHYVVQVLTNTNRCDSDANHNPWTIYDTTHTGVTTAPSGTLTTPT